MRQPHLLQPQAEVVDPGGISLLQPCVERHGERLLTVTDARHASASDENIAQSRDMQSGNCGSIGSRRLNPHRPHTYSQSEGG